MTNAEMQQIEKIKRIKEVLNKTTSEFLRRDYKKNLKRLERELCEYRRFYYGTVGNLGH